MSANNKEIKNSYLIIGLFMAYVLILVLPSLNESFWFLDDHLLTDVPFLLPPYNWNSIRTLFTIGAHADYYPIRDLHTLFDNWVFAPSIDGSTGLVYRVHNLIFFLLSYFLLFRILVKFKLNPATAALVASLWFINPIHLEMITWISGRKDILAIFYFLLSVLLFLHQYLFLALTAFLFSLLSKASFTLVPLILVAGVYLNAFTVPTKKHIRYLCIATVAGLASSVLQNYFYSEINDMRAIYTLDYRILSSLSALGRMMVGIFYYPANGIDIYNFGDWLDLNSKFMPLGVVIALGWLCSAGYALKTRNTRLALILSCILFLYVPISGLVFPHRSFYSVRYIEPLFLVTLLTLTIYFKNKFTVIKPFVLYALLFMSAGALYADSSNYDTTYTVTKKSLSLHPNSVALMASHLSSIDMIHMYKRSDATLASQAATLKLELDSKCARPPSNYLPNGHSCYVYLKDHYSQHADAYSIPELLKLGAPLTLLSEQQKLFIKTLRLNRFDQLETFNADFTNLRYFQYTKENRMEYLKFLCTKKEYEKAQSALINYTQRKLLRPVDIKTYIESNLDSHLDWNACLKP